MYEKLEKKVSDLHEKIEYAEYISQELMNETYALENEIEEAIEMSFENEVDKYKALLRKLKRVKNDNDIM